MRYLVFGDVHGNLLALEEMLAEERGEYDQLISHGDVVNYGPWSNECVELLHDLDCICLMGNHEEYFIKGIYPGQNEIAKTFFSFCYPFFKKNYMIDHYRNFYDIADCRITHTINNSYIFPDTDISAYTIDRNYIIGHSHYQFQKQYNGFSLYNTGSVGQNRKFINAIDYIVVDEHQHLIELKSLIYDVDKVINKMVSMQYPQMCISYYQLKKRK